MAIYTLSASLTIDRNQDLTWTTQETPLKRQCMANVNNSNVYIYKPKIDQYKWVNSLGEINLSKIKSTIKKK